MCESSHFPKLQSAKFEPLTGDGEVEVSYRSGASFKGQVEGHRKKGRGIFTWPNGDRYEGDYLDNEREGQGAQLWADGSRYEGDFHRDLRHGNGCHVWANKEEENCFTTYKGRFFQDRRHGDGTYTWSDGSSFCGRFYMDRKEGYGTFKFANDNVFEGLYHEDERAGPGVLTYSDGCQDVGLWRGEKLVKICSPITGAFTMSEHKDFDYNPAEHVYYLDKEGPSSQEVFHSTLTEPVVLYTPDNRVTEKVSSIFNIALDPRSLAVNKEAFDREFYLESEKETNISSEKVRLWNRTPSVIALQRHFCKHEYGKKSVTCNVDSIICGDRSKFKSKGPLESASEELIQAATDGNVNKVEDLLTSNKVSPDVADSNGHTALIGASVNWQMEVINCLLNHGADVNKLSDEGCSALSAGCIFFYPKESFKYNIAERYLEEPKEKKMKHKEEKSKGHKQEQQQHQQTSQAPATPRGILSKKNSTSQGKTVSQKDNESGETEKQKKNIQNVKQQVRIEENVNNNQDSTVILSNGQGDGEEFDSNLSMKYYQIEVSEQLIERCATQLSMNEKVVGGQRGHSSADLGTARHLAVIKNERERMKHTLDLLLKRGADPNASGVPMPVLFFAIKAADVSMVKALLEKEASTSIRLPKETTGVDGGAVKKGALAPLHIAAAIPGEEGVAILELLLAAGADPDVRAEVDDAFLDRTLMEEWNKDVIPVESQELLGGRTPLHIACARDDNYKNITRVVNLLLQHGANTSLLCNGFSPLALCIASGNDMAIDELLVFGKDVSLPLTHGVGSALCAATNTAYEYRRPMSARIHLIDKLVRARANVLAPIAIGPKRNLGTVVDYAYYMFNQDTHIAKTPYHALTHAERETFINRKKLLEHIGDIMRDKAVEREKRRLDDEERVGIRSASPSSGFVYIGAGAQLPPDAKKPRSLRAQPQPAPVESPMVKFEGPQRGSTPKELAEQEGHRGARWIYVKVVPPMFVKIRKPLFKYCYQCGRSVFIRLAACTRCKEVYYCSKVCKLKAWNLRHKEECIRVGGRSRSPSPRQRCDSPTPATHPDKGRRTTVAELSKDKHGQRAQSAPLSDNSIRSHHGNTSRIKSGHVTLQGHPSRLNLTSEGQKSKRPTTASTITSQSVKSVEAAHKALILSAKAVKKDVPLTTEDGRYLDNYSFV
ncbi:ankyrin repeat and MYND domain-containing protein 1-like isoform X3 [Mya arenaria]|uniref:ankyrin repeat and MYND domain-containing protein 1-like isoform X3 n=1 Tax=Mya arenaria TaxID=6604 RepID=UPI0022E536B0|nr:ankyrin repeat and MYND domain-containing protein 1-like isoform X3 [Mya arenaria]